jgi:hypothetical protein
MAAAPILEEIVSVRRCFIAVLALCAALPAGAATQVLVVAGRGGEAQFEQRFQKWTEQMTKASVSVTGDAALVRGLVGEKDADRAKIEAALRAAAQGARGGDRFVLVLLGHGSFDGSDYRFNNWGDDLTGAEFKALLEKFPEGVTQLVVAATSASGALVDALSGPRRLVIAASKSGERNAVRFTGYWAEALGSSDADKDKDGNVTAQEAYDYANRKVAESFKTDASIATEHSRLAGPDASRFVVARLGAAALFASDTQLAALRVQQEGIEQRIDQLRAQKAQLAEDDYYNRLEPVLLEMARLGQRIDARLSQLGVPAGGGNEKQRLF